VRQESEVLWRWQLQRQTKADRGATGAMLCQSGNVFGVLSQWWQHNGKHGEAVPQIFTKAAVLHHGGQILVRGSYNAHVYRDRVFAANARKDPFLHHP
jgi:hypothetical protein